MYLWLTVIKSARWDYW